MTKLMRASASMLIAVQALVAQSAPPVRPVGSIRATSHDPLGSVSQVRPLPGGRLLVNDNRGRKLVIFDSSLSHATIIADSSGASGLTYTSTLGGLIAYRGDSSLFVDPTLIALVVLDANGKVLRTMAPPEANQIYSMIGGPFGTPGLDAKGRLVYRAPISPPPDPGTGEPPILPDSALIVRFEFGSRTLDTVAKFKIPAVRRVVTPTEVQGGTLRRMSTIVDPVSWTDAWAILSDGTIAVVRGQDYRVDFFDGSNQKRSGPKMPFDWHRLTDADKSSILDSVRIASEKVRVESARKDSLARAVSSRPRAALTYPPLMIAATNEMPDYLPAFLQGAPLADAHGRLWIRTSQRIREGVVYDVVDKKGTIVDRVVVPPGRVIAGFGLGDEVYMGVVDGNITRLERAGTR